MDSNTLIAYIAAAILIAIVFYTSRFTQYSYRKDLKDLHSLDPTEFEYFCADYLKNYECFEKATVIPAIGNQGDGGRDIIGYKDGKKYVVECKRYAGSVGRPIVQKLHSVVITEEADYGMIMTTGTYTEHARDYAILTDIILLDRVELTKYYSMQKSTV